MLTEEQKQQFMNSIIPNKTILTCTHHYGMTIPYFFLVLNKTKRTITIIQLETKKISTDKYGQAGACIPAQKINGSASAMTKRLTKYGFTYERNILKIWDGKPKEFDTYD